MVKQETFFRGEHKKRQTFFWQSEDSNAKRGPRRGGDRKCILYDPGVIPTQFSLVTIVTYCVNLASTFNAVVRQKRDIGKLFSYIF